LITLINNVHPTKPRRFRKTLSTLPEKI